MWGKVDNQSPPARRGKEDTKMTEEEIKDAQELLAQIGRGEQNGMIVVVSREEVDEDTSKIEGRIKVHNMNPQQRIEVMTSAVGIPADDLAKMMLLSQLLGNED
jgi:hypothetical protein